MIATWIVLGVIAYVGVAAFIGKCIETPDDDEIERELHLIGRGGSLAEVAAAQRALDLEASELKRIT